MPDKPPQVFLFFLSGSRKGKIDATEAQVVRIGRQPYCEVKLDPYQDIPASGDHCHIIREADGYYLLDSGSTFGTFLNGNAIQGRVKLSTGDVIECGRDANAGREGPRLKFYLETDLRKCPVCEGPVYKRHFKCPTCRKKTCLRCIDFGKKVCLNCAAAPAHQKSAGFEVVEDDSVKAKKPARVILSGKEAAKVKKHKEKKAAAKAGASPKSTEAVPAPNLGPPFCTICQDFVKGQAFVCPACGSEVCASHKTGRVCQPCAGVSTDPVAPKKTTKATKVAPATDLEGVEAELVVPPSEEKPPPLTRNFPRFAEPPQPPPGTTRFSPPRVPGPNVPVGQPVRGGYDLPPTQAKKATEEIKNQMPPAVRTGVASCARCKGPLGAGTFCCRSCRRILCYAHVAVDDCCEDCYLARRDGRATAPRAPTTPAPLPRPMTFLPDPSSESRPAGHRTMELPAETLGAEGFERGATISEIEALDMMPLLDTEKEADADDDLARPPPGTSSSEDTTGLSFVCPHCDAPLDAAARACPRCRKVL